MNPKIICNVCHCHQQKYFFVLRCTEKNHKYTHAFTYKKDALRALKELTEKNEHFVYHDLRDGLIDLSGSMNYAYGHFNGWK